MQANQNCKWAVSEIRGGCKQPQHDSDANGCIKFASGVGRGHTKWGGNTTRSQHGCKIAQAMGDTPTCKQPSLFCLCSPPFLGNLLNHLSAALHWPHHQHSRARHHCGASPKRFGCGALRHPQQPHPTPPFHVTPSPPSLYLYLSISFSRSLACSLSSPPLARSPGLPTDRYLHPSPYLKTNLSTPSATRSDRPIWDLIF